MSIQSFIYHEANNNWVEETNIIYHDLVALLDEETKTIYLWNGPESTITKLQKGKNSLDALFEKFDNKKFIRSLDVKVLDKEIPSKIEKKIDELLSAIEKEELSEQLRFTHFFTIKGYFILLLTAVILPIVSLVNIMRSLMFELSNNNYAINSVDYSQWLDISSLLIFISLILFIIMVVVGFYESDKKVMIYASAGILTSVGILLLTAQDVFIFLFQEGSTTNEFLISISDLWIFLILNLFAHATIILPTAKRLLEFHKNYKDLIF